MNTEPTMTAQRLLSEEEVREISEREAKATKGPWQSQASNTFKITDKITVWNNSFGDDGKPYSYHDTQFMQHSREDIPALLSDRQERLRRERVLVEELEYCQSLFLLISNDSPEAGARTWATKALKRIAETLSQFSE